MTDPFKLKDHGITVAEIHRNLPPSALYEHAIRYDKDASIAENGALVAYSGAKTGRSPKDKRIVKHPESEERCLVGHGQCPARTRTFAINRERARDYLNIRDRIYCFDGFAGWDRIIRSRYASSARGPITRCSCTPCSSGPRKQELASFGKPDFVIYNAGAFPANSLTVGHGFHDER